MTVLLTLALSVMSASGIEFPGPHPGQAIGQLDENRLVLKNKVLSVSWRLADGRLQLAEVEDRIAGHRIQPTSTEAFHVISGDGTSLPSSRFRRVGPLQLVRLAAQRDSVNRSRRFAGWQATVALESPGRALAVSWRATLRDDANYVIYAITLSAKDQAVNVESVELLNLEVADAKVMGTVDGSPVVSGNLFFACEHPMADNRAENGRVICSSRCVTSLQPGTPWSRSAVIGVVPRGQLRRAFLYYVDRERARPYRLFLHYNSWWDIANGGKLMQENECVEAIHLFGRELVEKRGVSIDSFVFDDGWDAPTSPDIDELTDEIRMAFGSGTQLLELYVTPQLMQPKAWDVLAACARWSRQNADVLVDAHWVGGDPGKGEVYGYASWSPRKGILVLRNPSDTADSIVVDLKTAFDLPANAARTYRVTTRQAAQDRHGELDLATDQRHRFDLKPFEVRVFEAVAR